MPKHGKQSRAAKPKSQPDFLKGWQQIATFLGQPVSVAERWAKGGMPLTRQGRFVIASPGELNEWISRESGEPVQVAIEEADLSAELKRGLSYVRRARRQSSASRSSSRKKSPRRAA